MASEKEQGSFRSRFTKQQPNSATVKDEENDFPFSSVSFARVGSAHIACNSKMDSDSAALMMRISGTMMQVYQPEALPTKVFFDLKVPQPEDSPLIEYVPDGEALSDGSSHFYRDQQLLKLLYLCVQVRGQVPTGDPGYCYFGVFADEWMNYWKTHQSDRPFNPKDIHGIVLARATGSPSPEIQEFMRVRFSFAEDCCILEVSRS